MRTLIAPYGGKLSVLYVTGDNLASERQRAIAYPSWDLTERQVCDIELLMNGALSPLSGFMNREEYDTVVRNMRLLNGLVWSIPIVLDVSAEFAEQLTTGEHIALRDREGVVVATMKVEVKWIPDRELEARETYGTTNMAHPGVFNLFHRTGPVYIGGPVSGFEPPAHYDFKHLRNDPTSLRQKFLDRGWLRVVAFQTRNPMHRAHFELTTRAAKAAEANLLLHPAVGM